MLPVIRITRLLTESAQWALRLEKKSGKPFCKSVKLYYVRALKISPEIQKCLQASLMRI